MRAGELIKRFSARNQLVVVASAMHGVTDLLRDTASKARIGKTSYIKKCVQELHERHKNASSLLSEDVKDEVENEIDSKLKELENVLLGICYLGELTPRSLDYIMSFGEVLLTPILAGSVKNLGLKVSTMDGGEAGIITDENFGNASPLPGIERRIAKRLLPLLEKKVIPIITGFIGESRDGRITTLGRGGSDYSATLIGSAIDANEIWFWKETDGILSADPKVISDAVSLPSISYDEAAELSYFGAQVLHPRAIDPAARKNIPIRVKNFLKPDFPGTVIQQKQTGNVVKAITVIRNAALINISGSDMVGSPGSAARIFSALGKGGVNIIMISQASSERTISMIIDEGHLEPALSALKAEFDKLARDITYDRDVCALAVVGAGMRGTPGIAGRLFSSLGKNKVNVMMIAQGSSEHNISWVVKSEDMEKAMHTVHREFLE